MFFMAFVDGVGCRGASFAVAPARESVYWNRWARTYISRSNAAVWCRAVESGYTLERLGRLWWLPLFRFGDLWIFAHAFEWHGVQRLWRYFIDAHESI